MKNTFISILLFILLSGCTFMQKMPEGTSVISKTYSADEDDIEFMYDLTYKKDDKKISEQEIFDTLLVRIDQAQEYILLDMFLYNDYLGGEESAYRNISAELTRKLVNKKKQIPGIKIDVLTDPINCAYQGGTFHLGDSLEKAGINLIITDLTKLRDSNYLYSPIWRAFIQWFGNKKNSGFLPHPFSTKEPKVTFRTYFNLLNFKANHRKVFIADNFGEMTSIITSANPHDGSSAHSNIALEVRGGIWESIYNSEQTVAEFSKGNLQNVPDKYFVNNSEEDDYKVNLVTEKEIRNAILRTIKALKKDDNLSIAMFYISDRKVIKEILKASERGVKIRMILDPSKDAFGRQKSGVPNRQVANELKIMSDEKIEIKWYDTHGEQFHTKILYCYDSQGNAATIAGSANYTKRNIGDYNLETNLVVKGKREQEVFEEIEDYFNTIWSNQGQHYTADYAKYEDTRCFKRVMYLLYEKLGANTF